MIKTHKTVSNKAIWFVYPELINRGLDEKFIYQKTGLNKDNVYCDNGRISYQTYLSCINLGHENNIPLFDETIWRIPFLGFDKAFGELFSLCLNCINAKESLAAFIRYREIIADTDSLLMTLKNGKVIIQCINNTPGPMASMEALGNFIFIYQLLEFYNPGEQIACNTHFVGDPWFDLIGYDNYLRGSVKFNMSVNALIFDANLLLGTSSVCNSFLLPYLEDCARKKLTQVRTIKPARMTQLQDKVCTLLHDINRDNEFSKITIDIICKELNVSRWTLRRKLGDEGTSYQDIITVFRREEASTLLTETKLLIGEISDQLGFSSQGAFTKFFCQQVGMTPSEYRIATQQHQSLIF